MNAEASMLQLSFEEAECATGLFSITRANAAIESTPETDVWKMMRATAAAFLRQIVQTFFWIAREW
jgi:hypothetical protein